MWLQSRGRRAEPGWPQAVQAQPPALPPQSARSRRPFLVGRARRPAQHPWLQAQAAVPPPWVPSAARARRPPLVLVARRRTVTPVALPASVSAAGQRRRPVALASRRGRAAQPPWPIVVLPIPVLVPQAHRRRGSARLVWLRRARIAAVLPVASPPLNLGVPVPGPTHVLGQAVNAILGSAPVRLAGQAANRLRGSSGSNKTKGGGPNQLGG